jgi:hypothetical protein
MKVEPCRFIKRGCLKVALSYHAEVALAKGHCSDYVCVVSPACFHTDRV